MTLMEPSSAFSFSPPEILTELDPPHHVLETWSLGELVILAGLDDDAVVELDLSPDEIASGLRSDGIGDRRLRAAVWKASGRGALDWLSILRNRTMRSGPMWSEALGVTWSVHNSLLEPWMLTTGPTGVRCNSLLHVVNASFTVTDIHAYIAEVANDLAQEKLSRLEDRALMLASMSASAVAGWFTSGVSTPLAVKATEWSYDRLTKVDPWIESLAVRFALAALLAGHDPRQAIDAASRLHNEAHALSSASPSSTQGKRIRMLLAAREALLPETESAEHSVMPRLTGMRLSDAVDTLRIIGRSEADVIFVDACQPVGQGRTPFIFSRWVVKGQSPNFDTPLDGSTRIALAFGKEHEYARPAHIAERLS